jgi:hypothetical protein
MHGLLDVIGDLLVLCITAGIKAPLMRKLAGGVGACCRAAAEK